ncbi:MAG: Gfo/Idh/MocA family oxidoreductase [Acidobacteria bacterium]|nr:Gfo/Idh/MocA family oxidoreductase [Acidobacteriota bacterium]MDA1236587.1 Gfo/Idh/MocA family oxidoreductase [Acidobacteriota bacterium]
MQKVKWGIISTAKIGLDRVIGPMQQGELCDIKAIASRDLEKAKRAADKLGIPKAYGSYEELLADSDIEAVYNPLPNHLHVPLSIQAAEAGKHVLCEKPLSMNAAEAEQLIAARDRTGVLIQEAFMVRWHPQWMRVREIVRSGEIGELRGIQGLFSYHNVDPNNVRNLADIGGGGMMDIGVYPTVVSRYLFDAEPTRVVALLDRDPNFRTDRLGSVIYDFPAGQASFMYSTQMVPYQRMQICGTKGRIEVEIPFNAPDDKPCRIFIDAGKVLGGLEARIEFLPICNQYELQGDGFSRHIRNGEPLEFPLENAVAQMKIVDASFRSEKSRTWENV